VFKTAPCRALLGGALSGICFLAVWSCVCNWIYDRVCGYCTNAPYPWLWDASYLPAWFLNRVLPGAPLGALTSVAFHLWRRGERAKLASLCRKAGFIASLVLGIQAGLMLHEEFLICHEYLTSVDPVDPNCNWAVEMGRDCVTASWKRFWSYGALQWSFLLLIVDSVLQRQVQ
jgi:hypothetical protein